MHIGNLKNRQNGGFWAVLGGFWPFFGSFFVFSVIKPTKGQNMYHENLKNRQTAKMEVFWRFCAVFVRFLGGFLFFP